MRRPAGTVVDGERRPRGRQPGRRLGVARDPKLREPTGAGPQADHQVVLRLRPLGVARGRHRIEFAQQRAEHVDRAREGVEEVPPRRGDLVEDRAAFAQRAVGQGPAQAIDRGVEPHRQVRDDAPGRVEVRQVVRPRRVEADHEGAGDRRAAQDVGAGGGRAAEDEDVGRGLALRRPDDPQAVARAEGFEPGPFGRPVAEDRDPHRALRPPRRGAGRIDRAGARGR